MSQDRRFDEEEAREVFAIAAQGDSATLSAEVDRGGFTLQDLKEIAEEAGIHPDRVAEAASVVAARGTWLPQAKSLGMRVSVGQVVPLSRRPTDAEWDVLVSELRSVFDAPGEVREQGGAREWSNGALHVLLEPTAEGHQLRMTTVNRRLRSLNRMGAMLAVWGLVFIAVLLPGLLADGSALSEILRGLLPSLIVAGGGVGFIAFTGLSLPSWVEERRKQFDSVAERARGLIGKPPDTERDTG